MCGAFFLWVIFFLRFFIVCVLDTHSSVLLFVTVSFCALSYALRAVFAQYRFTDVLERCVRLYLFNQGGHA